jgi:cyclopropane-fatty-acyl-phospholipid synthase
MDYVARKLRLLPGEHVLDAGCGWGGFAVHLARHYGVFVRACNVSRPQLEYAARSIARERLDAQVELVQDDYRNVTGRYDAVVSLGMLEHVGKAAYPEFGRWLAARLNPDRGHALLHFIGRSQPAPLDGWIARHIFPGAYPPTLGEVAALALEPQRLVVTDVENLRAHYVLTLGHWLDRFEHAAGLVRREHGERYEREWRVYLAGSKAAFETGFLQLFQVTLAVPGSRGGPLTRAPLYKGYGGRSTLHGSEDFRLHGVPETRLNDTPTMSTNGCGSPFKRSG